jgi:hypothetical protein
MKMAGRRIAMGGWRRGEGERQREEEESKLQRGGRRRRWTGEIVGNRPRAFPAAYPRFISVDVAQCARLDG